MIVNIFAVKIGVSTIQIVVLRRFSVGETVVSVKMLGLIGIGRRADSYGGLALLLNVTSLSLIL
jgi:hypothetical protein